jgi:hypothetical protein
MVQNVDLPDPRRFSRLAAESMYAFVYAQRLRATTSRLGWWRTASSPALGGGTTRRNLEWKFAALRADSLPVGR